MQEIRLWYGLNALTPGPSPAPGADEGRFDEDIWQYRS